MTKHRFRYKFLTERILFSSGDTEEEARARLFELIPETTLWQLVDVDDWGEDTFDPNTCYGLLK